MTGPLRMNPSKKAASAVCRAFFGDFSVDYYGQENAACMLMVRASISDAIV